ncbi:MAG: type II toxin-antitoxin system VapC family toxin [Bryobacteraceae bacterium]
MSDLILDASVIVKWVVLEDESEQADSLLADFLGARVDVHVPDLLYCEIASVLWKKVRREELSVADASRAAKQMERFPFRVYQGRDLFSRALAIGIATKRSAYDCTYLALAEQVDAPLVTADERFHRALAGTGWSNRVALLKDFR